MDQLLEPDLIILPGSKNTIEDLSIFRGKWSAERLVDLHDQKRSNIFGICGGYQMLGRTIADPLGIESTLECTDGLGLLPVTTTITNDKTTVQSEGELVFNGKSFNIKGYEIHMGETKVSERLTTTYPAL